MSCPACKTRENLKTRTVCLLIAIAAFLMLIPWAGMLDFEPDRIRVDRITTSTVMAMTLAVSSSLASWSALSCAARSIKPMGIVLSTITSAALIIPFLDVLGPAGGVVVGVVAGFSAFMLQKKTTCSAGNFPVISACATLAAAYVVLIMLMLVLTVQNSVWDTGDGIGSWSGTAEGIEEPAFAGIFNVEFVYFLAIIPSLTATVIILGGKNED